MANFFKGMLRTNTSPCCGDLEGPMTQLKNGRMTVTIEKGKCIAWIVGRDDVELSKQTVKNLEFIGAEVIRITGNPKQEDCAAAIYKIEMANGDVGTLRLDHKYEDQIKNMLI